MRSSRKILRALAGILPALLLALPVTASSKSYTVVDYFGPDTQPVAKTMSENMEIVWLNEQHQPYAKDGRGVKLTASSEGREYITYDVPGVTSLECTAIVSQSVFASQHGWGISLGVTDDPNLNFDNNTENIDLSQIIPIYLDNHGRPFIYYGGEWLCYISDKYSFAPSAANPREGLRPFTVPPEVQERKYPMISVEVYKDGKWTPVSAEDYVIDQVKFLGGDKIYSQRIRVKNLSGTSKIRVGMDYIRQTLKVSSNGDTAADAFTAFPKDFDESIYLTGVKMVTGEPYTAGYSLPKITSLKVDTAEADTVFAYGEPFSSKGLTVRAVYADGSEGTTPLEFEVDASGFNSLEPGKYTILVKSGNLQSKYTVQVNIPTQLKIDASGAQTVFRKGGAFSPAGLSVTAVSMVGTKEKVEKEVPLSLEQVTIDTSGVKMDADGRYTVLVSVGKGDITQSASYEITVQIWSVGFVVLLTVAAVLAVAAAVTVALLVIHKKAKGGNE